MTRVVDSFSDSTFTRGDTLMKQDDEDDSVYVLARGTVVVELETQLGEKIALDELGMGSVFGEIAWALKSKRGASIIATSPGLLFKIPGDSLRNIANNNKELSDRLWDTCGRRLSENVFANELEHQNKSRRQIRDIVHNMMLFTVKPENKRVEFRKKANVMLLSGVAFCEGCSLPLESPAVIRTNDADADFFVVNFTSDSKFMCEPSNVAIRGVNPSATGPGRAKTTNAIDADHRGRSKSGRLETDVEGLLNKKEQRVGDLSPQPAVTGGNNDGGVLVFPNGDVVNTGDHDMEMIDTAEVGAGFDMVPHANPPTRAAAPDKIKRKNSGFGLANLGNKLEVSVRYKEPQYSPKPDSGREHDTGA
jgi:hypothetical protein